MLPLASTASVSPLPMTMVIVSAVKFNHHIQRCTLGRRVDAVVDAVMEIWFVVDLDVKYPRTRTALMVNSPPSITTAVVP